MIDWARVTELQNEIGAEDFADVVLLFLEEADEVVAKLPGCTDAPSLEAALHFLKGSALNLGFQTLAQLCQTGERLAAMGDTAIARAAVAQASDASKAAFDSGLETLGGTHAT